MRLPVTVLALAAIIAGLPAALAQSGDDNKVLSDKIDSLEKRLSAMERELMLSEKIDTLEERITTMERNLSQQLSNILKQTSPASETSATSDAGNSGEAASDAEAEAKSALAAVMRSITAGDIAKAKTDVAALLQKYGSTRIANSARRISQELQVVGKATPADWGIEKWFQGESDIDLAGDDTTLVVFWETWCPYCQRELPKLEPLFQSLGDDGLKVVGLTKITKSATETTVGDFIKQHGLSFPIAKEDGSASRYFGIRGVPAVAVVKGGKVVWRGHPARLSEAQLKGWL